MFSKRMDWSRRANRLSRRLEEKRRIGADVLDLTGSNPTRAGIEYPVEALREALGDVRGSVYDPSPRGLSEARKAVADYYGRRGRSVSQDQILLTASTSEAYAFAFKLLADPGDSVLVPRPSYPLVEHLASLEAVRVESYPLHEEDGWSPDLGVLESRIDSRTRAVVLVNPNNPTGSFLTRSEREALVRLAAKRRLALVCDEVFSDYAFAPDPERVETLVDVRGSLTLCLSGLSKICGLPQVKLGWIVVAGPEPLRQQAARNLELIADTYLSVSTAVQVGAARLLAAFSPVRDRIRLRVRDNLLALRSNLGHGSACVVPPVEGGWYAIIRLPRVRSEEDWCLEILERDDVLVQPGYFFDFEREAYAVISLLTPSEPFLEGIRRLGERVRRTIAGDSA